MAKRCIGIDIGPSHLHAVQLTGGAGRFHVEKTFSAPTCREPNFTAESLKTLVASHGFDRRAPVAVSTPHNQVFFRNIKKNLVPDKPSRTNPDPTAEFNFPIPSRDVITADCPNRGPAGNKNSLLVTATNRKSLESRLDHLEKAKMRCCLADAPIFALLTAVTTNHPQFITGPAIIVYTDHSHIILAVTSDKDILIARNLPLCASPSQNDTHSTEKLTQNLLQEIEISWRAAFHKKIPENTNIVLAGAISDKPDLISSLRQSLNCQITTVDLSAKVTFPAESEPLGQFALAQGLALRALAPNDTVGVNFIKAVEKSANKNSNCKKHAILTISLLAALTAAYLTGIFISKARLENKYLNIRNQIRQVFIQTLPDQATNIVDEPAQMDQSLQLLKKQYASLKPFAGSTLDPLAVLHSITANTPENLNVKIDSISITASSANITALCGSFEDAYKWEKLLSSVPQFNSVKVRSPRRQPDSRVKFNVSLSFDKD